MPVRPSVTDVIRRFNLHAVGRWFVYGSLIGVVAGAGAIAFQVLCQVGSHFLLDLLAGFRPAGPAGEAPLFAATRTPLRPWLLPLVVGFGGLLSGVLTSRFAPEAAGHGTDAAIDSFHRRRGVVRGRVPLVKAIASALTLGSGGSGGREGPIAQIGAGFGSALAGWLKLSDRDRRVLMLAGVGAGVGSIFRAPLAGALFAAEILYSEPDFESDVIIPAAISTIVAYCVFSFWFGFGSLFSTPAFTFHSAVELVPYTVLAVVVALGSGLFVEVFYGVHRLFDGLPVARWARPAIGGAATGLVAMSLNLTMGRPAVLDVLSFGYGSIQHALYGRLAIGVLLALALGKMLTTSLSISSGGSGGVFGPSMVIGGSLGGVVGILAQRVMPGVVASPGAYVVVGMAGFFAAAAKTPISTLVMVSEMTGNYQLLLPSLWVCALAYLLSRHWRLYRNQLPTRFDSPAHRGNMFVDLLQGIHVGDLPPRPPVQMIPETAGLGEVIGTLIQSTQDLFPVVGRDGRLVGTLSAGDVRQLMEEHHLGNLVIAGDLAARPRVTLTPQDGLESALQEFVRLDVDELLVVEAGDPGKVVGLISRHDLISTYNRRRLEVGSVTQSEHGAEG